MSLLTLRSELRVARTTYRSITRARVSDQAPVDQQHRYWRLHDTTKETYARLDWRYQKAILRAGLVVLAACAPVSALLPDVVPLAIAAAAFVGHRIYVVLTRHAPGEED